MDTIKEEVLNLSLEEKIDLFHALQKNLQWDNDFLEEDLSAELLDELRVREVLVEKGELKWISKDEFDSFLKKRRYGI